MEAASSAGSSSSCQENAICRESISRIRPRISRACDSCRKNKVKCPLTSSGSCQHCINSRKPCTFKAIGVKRERPPSKREIEQLNLRIRTLEKLLTVLAPSVDLESLPTTDEPHPTKVGLALSENRGTLQDRILFNDESSDHEELYNVLRLLADFRISPKHYQDFGLKPSKPFSVVHSFFPELNPATLRLAPRFGPSPLELVMEKFESSLCSVSNQLPPMDLADSLILLFFDKVNIFERVVHRSEFTKFYNRGYAETDRSFRALCFAIFACGSQFSYDSRVMLTSQNGTLRPQTAGASFFVTSMTLVSTSPSPCKLFDLQAIAVFTWAAQVLCSPPTVWSLIGIYTRKVLDAEAHLDVAQWKTSIMKDQLRKRAVWYLVTHELIFCALLGRAPRIKMDTITIEIPLPLDDDALSRFCSDQSSNECDNIQRDLCSLFYSRCASGELDLSLYDKVTLPLLKLLTDQASFIPGITKWHKETAASLARALEPNIFKSRMNVRWDPAVADVKTLVAAARKICSRLVYLIVLRRLNIEDYIDLRSCLALAYRLIDILDHVRTRGALDLTASWSGFVLAPAASMLLYVCCSTRQDVYSDDRADAWAGFYRCINIFSHLKYHSTWAEQSSRVFELLAQAYITGELFALGSEGARHVSG